MLRDDLQTAFCESSPSSTSTPLLPQSTAELFPDASTEVDEHDSFPMSTPEVPMLGLVLSEESIAEETLAVEADAEAVVVAVLEA